MKKDDFLDILRDYLKDKFNPYEIENIICEYESYFLRGYLDHKKDIEIIDTLKSPKIIAEELFRQKKYENIKEEKLKNIIKRRYIYAKQSLNGLYRRLKKYMDDKLTADIHSYKKLNNISKKFTIYIISFLLFFIYFVLISMIILISILSIIFSVSLILILIEGIKFYAHITQISWLLFFILIFCIGCEILFWQMFISIIKVILIGIKKYCNWLKIKGIYFKSRKK